MSCLLYLAACHLRLRLLHLAACHLRLLDLAACCVRLLHLAAAEPALVATEPRLAEVQAFGSPDAWRAELAALRPEVNITC